jgi:hypothetical protein
LLFYILFTHCGNLFFQLIAKRYEKTSTIFTSKKSFSQWNDIFSDITIATAILDRMLHHCTFIIINGESYRLKERKEVMKQKQFVANTLFAEKPIDHIPKCLSRAFFSRQKSAFL